MALALAFAELGHVRKRSRNELDGPAAGHRAGRKARFGGGAGSSGADSQARLRVLFPPQLFGPLVRHA